MADETVFQRPGRIDAFFNRLVGKLVALGIGPAYMRVLDVRGRKSGRILSTPVNILELKGVLYLVAPRGNTNWVRNARAAGRVRLRRGRSGVDYRVEEIPGRDRPELLREYLKRYHRTVQGYFSIRPDADQEAFAAVAERHPVFRLTETD